MTLIPEFSDLMTEDGYDKIYPNTGTRQVLRFESVCAGRLRARP